MTKRTCPFCMGTGIKDYQPCPLCLGIGQIKDYFSFMVPLFTGIIIVFLLFLVYVIFKAG